MAFRCFGLKGHDEQQTSKLAPDEYFNAPDTVEVHPVRSHSKTLVNGSLTSRTRDCHLKLSSCIPRLAQAVNAIDSDLPLSPSPHVVSPNYFVDATSGRRIFNCLVRSQSDSTCLSLKASPNPGDRVRTKKLDCTGPETNGLISNPMSADKESDISEPTSTMSRLADSKETSTIQKDSDLPSTRLGGDSPLTKIHTSLSYQSSVLSSRKTYQLVCRDGVPKYEYVTPNLKPSSEELSSHSDTSTPDSLGPVGLMSLLADSSGKPRLKAHLIAGPTNPLFNHRSNQSDESTTSSVRSAKLSSSSGGPSSATGISQSIHLQATSTPMAPRPGPSRETKMLFNMQATNHSSYGNQVRPSHVTGEHNSKPTAPLPVRKHHTRSPPIHLQPVVTSPASIHSNAQTLYPDSPTSKDAGRTGTSEFSSVSNWNSRQTTDVQISDSPMRPARSNFHSTSSTTQRIPPTRDHVVSQATLIRAPVRTAAPTESTSHGTSSVSIFPKQLVSQSSMESHDSGSKMTLSELRSFAERQRQLLTRQTHQLQAKEERLAWLKSLRNQTNDEALVGSAMLTHEQEKCLHQLRAVRGQTEQTRLNNEKLVNEIDVLSRSLSIKEVELDACRRRAEDMRQSLSAIDKCHVWLSKGSAQTRTPRTADKLDSGKRFDIHSVQLPFTSDKDQKHWHDGLMEAERLDRQITLAMNHSSQSKRSTRSTDPAYVETRQDSSRSSSSMNDSNVPQAAGSRIPPVSTTVLTNASSSQSVSTVHTSNSDFNSALSRTSSPPTHRRSSLRMLLHAAAASGDSRTISCFPRLKTPPRYASRAVINETYMRKICTDSVEKYKKTANEIYRANVERMQARQQEQPQQEHEKLRSGSDSDPPDRLARTPLEPGEVDLTQANESTRLPTFRALARPVSPVDSMSSSSSSSLELVGIEPSLEEVKKSNERDLATTDDEAKHTVGDVDSGLGGSDDTGQSEHNAANAPSHQVAVCLDDNAGTDASLSNASFLDGASRFLRPILRKTPSTGKPCDDVLREDSEVSKEQAHPTNTQTSRTVRFHPLALLLDAALEGDLDLVKEVASQVTDVSEPNDEGITALHNAVCAGRTEIADYLVRVVGADVNAGDTDGWTPLHCAASCGNLPLARLLVEHGASLHARTLSDHETPLEKCDQGDDEAECEEYLFFQQERLGSAASGVVYALFPRGLEAAGPGSADAHLQPDELAVYPNEQLRVIDREPPGEAEWMLAEKSDGTRGLIPRSHLSCYPLVRVPPASHPIPLQPEKPRPSIFWEEDEENDSVDSPSQPPVQDPTVQRVIEVELPDGDSPKVPAIDGDSSPSVHPQDEDPSNTDISEHPDLKTAL